MMFETVVGHSFKCVTEQSLQLSAQLQMKTINIRLQAFEFEGDRFGNGKLTILNSQAAFRNPEGRFQGVFILKLLRSQSTWLTIMEEPCEVLRAVLPYTHMWKLYICMFTALFQHDDSLTDWDKNFSLI